MGVRESHEERIESFSSATKVLRAFKLLNLMRRELKGVLQRDPSPERGGLESHEERIESRIAFEREREVGTEVFESHEERIESKSPDEFRRRIKILRIS